MNKNVRKTLQLIALAAVLMLAGCKKAPAQETAAPETTVPVQTTAETVMETTVETTQETEVVETVPKVTAPEAGSISYAEYLELSAEEQQAYYENFASADEFLAWMDNAKAEYEATKEPAETFISAENGNGEEITSIPENDGFFDEESVEDW